MADAPPPLGHPLARERCSLRCYCSPCLGYSIRQNHPESPRTAPTRRRVGHMVPQVDLPLWCHLGRSAQGCCSCRRRCIGAPVYWPLLPSKLDGRIRQPQLRLYLAELPVPARWRPSAVVRARAASNSSRARHWQLWWGLYCEYLLCLAGHPLRRVPVWECQFFVACVRSGCQWRLGYHR